MLTELIPRYENCRSYYGKAHIEYYNGEVSLISYQTKIGTISNGEFVSACGEYCLTRTTLRHLKEFLLQNGLEYNNKAYIVEKYF